MTTIAFVPQCCLCFSCTCVSVFTCLCLCMSRRGLLGLSATQHSSLLHSYSPGNYLLYPCSLQRPESSRSSPTVYQCSVCVVVAFYITCLFLYILSSRVFSSFCQLVCILCTCIIKEITCISKN